VEEFTDSEELRVDVIWGHIRDYTDIADTEDLSLYIQYPNGDTELLDLEGVGVLARAFVPIIEEGTYTFWAKREPSTYTPDSGITQLSSHTAKLIHHVGEATLSENGSIELDLEIVPETDTNNFATGTFTGTIYLDGKQADNAIISAYGPEWEVLETASDEEGIFELSFDSLGEWLIKANVELDEAGTLESEEYEIHSLTSTLLVDTEQEAETNPSSLFSLIGMLISGLLLGAAITIFVMRKR
jgi:hypothetical protein